MTSLLDDLQLIGVCLTMGLGIGIFIWIAVRPDPVYWSQFYDDDDKRGGQF